MTKSRSTPGRAGSHPATAYTLLAINEAVGEQLLTAPVDANAHAPRLTVPRAPAPTAPARMAALHEGEQAQRLEVRAMYEKCLDTFRTASRPQDTARGIDDAGAAVAFFVAANVAALTGADVSVDVLPTIERQLVELVRNVSNWDRSSTGERQFYFEQMAMLGVFVAVRAEQAKAGSVAERHAVREAARNYLRHLLGVNPDRLTIGPAGLSLRAAAH